jgi:hypothetical protein
MNVQECLTTMTPNIKATFTTMNWLNTSAAVGEWLRGVKVSYDLEFRMARLGGNHRRSLGNDFRADGNLLLNFVPKIFTLGGARGGR